MSINDIYLLKIFSLEIMKKVIRIFIAFPSMDYRELLISDHTVILSK